MISQDPGGGAAVASTSHRSISVYTYTVLRSERTAMTYQLFPDKCFWLNVASRRQ